MTVEPAFPEPGVMQGLGSRVNDQVIRIEPPVLVGVAIHRTNMLIRQSSRVCHGN